MGGVRGRGGKGMVLAVTGGCRAAAPKRAARGSRRPTEGPPPRGATRGLTSSCSHSPRLAGYAPRPSATRLPSPPPLDSHGESGGGAGRRAGRPSPPPPPPPPSLIPRPAPGHEVKTPEHRPSPMACGTRHSVVGGWGGRAGQGLTPGSRGRGGGKVGVQTTSPPRTLTHAPSPPRIVSSLAWSCHHRKRGDTPTATSALLAKAAAAAMAAAAVQKKHTGRAGTRATRGGDEGKRPEGRRTRAAAIFPAYLRPPPPVGKTTVGTVEGGGEGLGAAPSQERTGGRHPPSPLGR